MSASYRNYSLTVLRSYLLTEHLLHLTDIHPVAGYTGYNSVRMRLSDRTADCTDWSDHTAGCTGSSDHTAGCTDLPDHMHLHSVLPDLPAGSPADLPADLPDQTVLLSDPSADRTGNSSGRLTDNTVRYLNCLRKYSAVNCMNFRYYPYPLSSV